MRRFFPSLFVLIAVLLCIASMAYVFYEEISLQASFSGIQNYLEVSNQNVAGGMAGEIDGGSFGSAVDNIGDLNGDGVEDIVVGNSSDDSVDILFLNRNGAVTSYTRIEEGASGFGGTALGNFGESVGNIGDLDNDGVTDIVVGEATDAGGGSDRGAVWIIFLNADGTVKNEQKIGDSVGGLTSTLDDGDLFGSAVTGIGDMDDDGNEDIAVGAPGNAFLGNATSEIYILFLNADGTVKAEQKIDESTGGFGGPTSTAPFGEGFGYSVDAIGDLNLDGVTDLIIGAPFNSDIDTLAGKVWILFMNANGTVASETEIGTEAELALAVTDTFGSSVTKAGGDLNGDGIADVVVGAANNDTVYFIYLNRDGTLKGSYRIGDGIGGFNESVNGTSFGASLTDIHLSEGEGPQVYIGAGEDTTGGASSHGAVWFMNLDRRVASGNFVTPKSLDITVNGGVTCVASPDIFVSLMASGAEDVVVGLDANFVGTDWEEYTGTPMVKEVRLPEEDGEYMIYVLYRSRSRNQSILDFEKIRLDQAGNCGLVAEIEPVCDHRCEDLRFQLFLETPSGAEVVSDGENVRVTRIDGVETYYFEDKDDFDFNDVVIQADQSKCHTWSMKVTSVDAGWHHKVGLRVFYKGEEISREIIIDDAQLAIDTSFAFESDRYYPVCENNR